MSMKKIFILCLICFITHSAWAKKPEQITPDSHGYVGSLPNVSERFQKTQDENITPLFNSDSAFDDQNAIKPSPRDNPAFINIIMKKDKTSQYINDLNEIIPMIEKIQTSIEKKENVQKFNARSYYFKENTEFLRDKYKNKAESSYISFKKLMDLNTQVQTIAQLRQESEVYSPYVTAQQSGNIFSQNNITLQLDYLLVEIKKTLVVLKEAK